MSRRTRNRIHLWLIAFWVIVGLPVSWWLRYSVPWLVFLSVYAIIAAHASGLHHTREEDEHD
jgi:hypothetical protein